MNYSTMGVINNIGRIAEIHCESGKKIVDLNIKNDCFLILISLRVQPPSKQVKMNFGYLHLVLFALMKTITL
jgi:hypothetical protein